MGGGGGGGGGIKQTKKETEGGGVPTKHLQKGGFYHRLYDCTNSLFAELPCQPC